MNFEKLLENDITNFNAKFKKKYFLNHIKYLTKLHFEKCKEYKSLLSYKGIKIPAIKSLSDIPFLPARIFKDYLLISIKKKDIFKIMNSSGTSGNDLSQIVLNKKTSLNQIKALSKITRSIIGSSRLPTIIIDTRSTITNTNKFSARAAGILGFNNFSKDTIFALDENMELDINKVLNFIEKYNNQKILLFGFTFLIYKNFLQKLVKLNKVLDLPKAIMIHGGGWKKLSDLNISNKEFKSKIKKQSGIKHVFNYYGMVEQTGSIFFECNKGNFHTSLINDIIIRDKHDHSISKIGETGIVQVLSLIPESYPGHSILTEDEGIILGNDNCVCGKKGKYFKIIGRVKNSEIRGCSDVYK